MDTPLSPRALQKSPGRCESSLPALIANCVAGGRCAGGSCPLPGPSGNTTGRAALEKQETAGPQGGKPQGSAAAVGNANAEEFARSSLRAQHPPVPPSLPRVQRRLRNAMGSSKLRLPPRGSSRPGALSHSLGVFEPLLPLAVKGPAALRHAAAHVHERQGGEGLDTLMQQPRGFPVCPHLVLVSGHK